MPPVGFEPTISAGEWPQTYTLDRVATGTGIHTGSSRNNVVHDFTLIKRNFAHSVGRGGLLIRYSNRNTK